MGKKDKRAAAKNKPIAEAPTNSSNKPLMENLKTANACLVEEAGECRREIERLRIHLESLIAEEDIFHGIKHDVFSLIVSSDLGEFTSRAASETATTKDRDKKLKNELEVMAREANAKDVELSALIRKKDEKDKELEEFRNIIRSMKQANEHRRRKKNLICSVVAAVTLVAVAGAAALLTFSKMFKK